MATGTPTAEWSRTWTRTRWETSTRPETSVAAPYFTEEVEGPVSPRLGINFRSGGRAKSQERPCLVTGTLLPGGRVKSQERPCFVTGTPLRRRMESSQKQ